MKRLVCACSLALTAAAHAQLDPSNYSLALTVDLACFLNRFAVDDPIANCDSSSTAPLLNSLDFSCLSAKFAAGCP